jgi:hypothetical protein
MSVKDLISSALSQIASGTPAWKIQIPASFHHDKSAIQVIRDQFFTNEECLTQFSKVASITDPVERIGVLLGAVLNPYMDWKHEKPFNSILGEYLKESSNGYSFEIEQICHHPPAVGYRLTGPKFVIETTEGFESVKGLKPGINTVDLSNAHADISMTTDSGMFRWTHPSHRLQGILFGSKNSGTHGEFKVYDSSGLRFEGEITLPFKIKGKILDPKGKTIDSVSGDFKTGVYLKSNKKLWYEPVGFKKIVPVVAPEVLADKLYSENVWSKVYVHMRANPRNFKDADLEKQAVEEEQRAIAKTRGKFVSRFGFKLPKALLKKLDTHAKDDEQVSSPTKRRNSNAQPSKKRNSVSALPSPTSPTSLSKRKHEAETFPRMSKVVKQ